jgi:hypothetical protein
MQRPSAAGVAALAILSGFLFPVSAASGIAPSACGTWRAIPAESPTDFTYLYSVSGTSGSRDVWAVGAVAPYGDRTLTEHWAGRGWRAVASKHPGDWSSLSAVWSLSADDVWAVGEYTTPRSGFDTLAEHWDGEAWRLIPIATYHGANNWLEDLAFSGPDDGWAVGSVDYTDDFIATMTIHWDGATWDIVPSPTARFINSFKAVDVLSPSDVWAVGYSRDRDVYEWHPFAAHWDGAAWTVTDVPDLPNGAGIIEGVTAVAADDVWAVGSGGLIWHWDGTGWSMVEAPAGNGLYDVAAAGPDDIWAVGYTILEGHVVPLVEHWDGVAWTVVPTPRLYGGLSAVETLPGGHVWAVGSGEGQALSMHLKEC